MAGRARTPCACSLSVPRGQQEAQEDQPGSAHGAALTVQLGHPKDKCGWRQQTQTVLSKCAPAL